MSELYRLCKNVKGANSLKEIKPNDIFYIKHQWFRDVCFFHSFYSKWLDNIYNNYLDNKTFYIIRRKNIQCHTVEWLIHKRHLHLYVDGVFKEKERIWSRVLTHLILHFDEEREVYELTNTKKVMEFLKNKKNDINLKLIECIHDMLLENIDNRKGLRTNDIKILGQPFKPSPARYVKSDMKMLLDWYDNNKNKTHPLALVTLFHHKFENIHPFSDGNGRTGRILINYILSLHKYPPFIISRRFRKEYIDLMNQSDEAINKNLLNSNLKKYKPLIEFMYSQFKSSYWDLFLV